MQDFDWIKSEEVFQHWFRAAYELSQRPSVAGKDFFNVGYPWNVKGKSFGYDFLFKRTIRVPPPFHGNPDQFASVLIEFLIDNVLILYKDSVRVFVWERGVGFYKDCGDQIGGYYCQLSREGNLFTMGIMYQIYVKSHSVLMKPDALMKCDARIVKRSTACSAARRLRFFRIRESLDGLKSLLQVALVCAICFVLGQWLPKGNLLRGVANLVFICSLIFFALILLYIPYYIIGGDGKIGKWRDKLIRDAARGNFDLSSVHFPVLFNDHREVTEGIAKGIDHQVYIERLGAIVERAVSIGEQSG
jgi:hypothetical protein